MKHPILFLTALVGLAACDAEVESRKASVPPTEAPPPVVQSADPLVAAGPAATVQPSADANQQWAAAVVRVDPLSRQGQTTVKLYGVGGGDPAMNGLQTQIAFFRSAADGWAVFPVGDVLDYRVLSESPGRVDLQVEESVLDEATGQIGSRERRLIVAWTPAAGGAAPATVTVTPAQ